MSAETDADELFAEIDAAMRPLGHIMWLATHWRSGGLDWRAIMWLATHWRSGGLDWRAMKREATAALNTRIDQLTSLRDRLDEIGDGR